MSALKRAATWQAAGMSHRSTDISEDYDLIKNETESQLETDDVETIEESWFKPSGSDMATKDSDSEEYNIYNEIDRILRDLSSKKVKINNRKTLGDFLTQNDNGYILSSNPGNGEPNVLNLIAERKRYKDGSKAQKLLVKAILAKFPSFMSNTYPAGCYSPLLTASKHNPSFVENVLDSAFSNSEAMGRAIRDTDGTKSNCLHYSIQMELSPDLLVRLIEKAPPEALSAQDSQGYTPLDLAVQYKRCIPGQLAVVRHLLMKGDEALDKQAGRSPYLHHQKTRKDHENEKKLPVAIANPPLATGHPQRETSKGQDSSRKEKSPKDREKTSPNEQSKPTEGRSAPPRPESRTKKGKERPEPDAETADLIAKELKLHYMRSIFRDSRQKGEYVHSSLTQQRYTRTQAKAIEFLYGKDTEGQEICFDLYGEPLELTSERFKTIYGNFVFDSVLLYVALPQMRISIPARPPRNGNPAAGLSMARGRQDMTIVFEWLYNKGVRNIVKLLVDDMQDPPHSDMAIERALSKFEVEILDWRKVDLCPDTIVRSVPKVRELHLFWSGSNTALRAWSEPQGLSLETPERRQENLRLFQKRLNEQRQLQKQTFKDKRHLPMIDVPDPIDRTSQEGVKDSTKGDTLAEQQFRKKTHKWLTIMDKLADGIWGLSPLKKDEDIELPDSLKKDITVALIDDGVGIMNSGLAEKVFDGYSFDDGYDRLDLPGSKRPYYKSATGHGTLMAEMITRVCPSAKIFSCRLHVFPGQDRPHFTAKSAAEAIDYCATRGFDIICMSWTIKKGHAKDENEGKDDFKALEDALQNAAKKSLLFCAAPDEGSLLSSVFGSYYPVGYAAVSHSIFRIAAATSDNQISVRSGEEGLIDFLLPGHDVARRQTNHNHAVNQEYHTGSSVANALAAGLAALIMNCVRLAAIKTVLEGEQGDADGVSPLKDLVKFKIASNDVVMAKHLEAIKSPETMRRIFHGIINDNSGQQHNRKYLDVEQFFSGAIEKLTKAGADDSQKMEVITKLAKTFIQEAKISEV
ncbi:hypothetical protein FGLOB1_7536 [Fusarium globosum]|uniref:Peptidase S8/S53 domain-containing protein n=1 Tax=Fusarium globosum TaxID=78864 RepID=A0A8H5Y6W8_9HYPO|nr:hypothetical protein FGLOB1_7536 [Fusarium globosum]